MRRLSIATVLLAWCSAVAPLLSAVSFPQPTVLEGARSDSKDVAVTSIKKHEKFRRQFEIIAVPVIMAWIGSIGGAVGIVSKLKYLYILSHLHLKSL